ncbi:hypothetical protein [Candidatus Magnetominusculus dajiuhuensis]|uniref:hypothetical protein n=1 Tax=Candidatus Magnetominusculus dajiuhuensis TaxID=3137712 RepID=UPI003B437BED
MRYVALMPLKIKTPKGEVSINAGQPFKVANNEFLLGLISAGKVKLADTLHQQPETAPITPTTEAIVPVLITRAMRAELRNRGYADDDLAKMTPQAAHDILSKPTATKQSDAATSPTPAIEPRPEAAKQSAVSVYVLPKELNQHEFLLKKNLNYRPDADGGGTLDCYFCKGMAVIDKAGNISCGNSRCTEKNYHVNGLRWRLGNEYNR